MSAGTEKIIAEQYLHINNGGVTFAVVDEGHGPMLRIRSSSFGTAQNTFQLHLRNTHLLHLGQMLLRAAEYESLYTPEYYNAPEESRIGRGLYGAGENWRVVRDGLYLRCGYTLVDRPNGYPGCLPDKWLGGSAGATTMTRSELKKVLELHEGAVGEPVEGMEYLMDTNNHLEDDSSL